MYLLVAGKSSDMGLSTKTIFIIVYWAINHLEHKCLSASSLSMAGELPHNLKAIQVFVSPEGDLLCSDVEKDLLLQYLLSVILLLMQKIACHYDSICTWYHLNALLLCGRQPINCPMKYNIYRYISMVSCQKGPTRHAYAWQIGPFWQDTLDMLDTFICYMTSVFFL